MFLSKLHIKSVRNIGELELNFGSNITIFLGANGAGKTSILEAIALLSLPKSFRTSDTYSIINDEDMFFSVGGTFTEDSGIGEKLIEVICQKNPSKRRVLKVNGANHTMKEFLKAAYVVTFVPQDLNLVDLGPSHRRAYINRVLAKSDFMYIEHLQRYEKVLKERNAVLKRINESLLRAEDLEVWDEQLVDQGAELVARRIRFLSEIAPLITDHYHTLAGEKDKIGIQYISKIHEVMGEANPIRLPAEVSLADLKELFKGALLRRQKRDIILKSTSVGPHRDDIEFLINEHSLSSHGSRGECRSVLISLKLTELEALKKHSGSSPILLLDDVFSELDPHRQTQLLELISPYQTFITTNSEEHFRNYKSEKTIFNVSDGKAQ